MNNLQETTPTVKFVNFYLLFLAILISFLYVHESRVLSLMCGLANKINTSSCYIELKAQLSALKEECSQIDMTDEFAKYARLQRKIIKLQDEIKKEAYTVTETNIKVKLVLRSVAVLVCATLGYTFRDTPVIQMPSEWLFPVASVLSWPASEPDCVSFLMWTIISNRAVTTLSDIL